MLMLFLKVQLDRLRDQVFNQIHGKNLVYNTCWEDPRCDRELLQLNQDSKVVMITSAGDNTLDYLLDEPAEIHSLDVNPRQTALLDLKLATFEHAGYEDLYQMFGIGYHPNIDELYYNKLRPHLYAFSRSFWDDKLKYFKDKKRRGSFYFYGTAGHFAWLFNQYLRVKPGVRKKIDQLLAATTLEEQSQLYYQIEPKLVPSMVEWVLERHTTLSMLGVPRPQRKMILDEYPGGLSAYIKDSLRQVFTQIHVRENYFWRLYLKGQYTKDCCPNYLKEANFETIRDQNAKIDHRTGSVADFLKENPGKYTHFVLLDHQDWLAANLPKALDVEWRLILENSVPGAKVLIRSAAREVDFIPEFVHEAVNFEKVNNNTLYNLDRVGTYSSTYLGTIT